MHKSKSIDGALLQNMERTKIQFDLVVQTELKRAIWFGQVALPPLL